MEDHMETALEFARQLGENLKQRGAWLATAESCTGGGIATALTEIPGSSEWFAGALVTYTNTWKQRFLGVQESTLAQHGAVSSETVHEMLQGVLERCNVQAALAVSGIAGPGGAVPGKPVGTVFVGAAYKDQQRVECCHFSGDRHQVRQKTIVKALAMLLEILQNLKPQDDF